MKINGLLQNKDVGGVMHVWNVNDVVRVGEYMKVKVVKIDKERMRVWVSSKALDGTFSSFRILSPLSSLLSLTFIFQPRRWRQRLAHKMSSPPSKSLHSGFCPLT